MNPRHREGVLATAAIQYPKSGCLNCTFRHMVKDGTRLLRRHPREPLQKVVKGGIVFQILEDNELNRANQSPMTATR